MKTSANFEIKGVKVEMTFEGSVSEMVKMNTAMISGTKEWLDFFQQEGNRIFYLIDKAVERSAETSKNVMIKDKEVRDFEKFINRK